VNPSDADGFLVEAVRTGDPDAWRTLIDRYQGRLVSFARRMLADKSEAEDLVQDTFLGLLRSLAAFDPTRSLETYLFAILRNKISDHLRRRKGGQRISLDQIEGEDESSASIDRATPAASLLQDETHRLQRAMLARMLREWVETACDNRRFQDLIVVEMLVVLGLRNKEVAADLSLSETAVAGVKFRVLEQWRKLLAAQGQAYETSESDLDYRSTVAAVWREDGVSCLKRSTLGRHLMGVLDPEWSEYVEFHVQEARCPRCTANLDDLRGEDDRDEAARESFRQRCFTSSVGFLSHPGC
jgi:RNA polymerase sigma-70 factor (ECF subfamily)